MDRPNWDDYLMGFAVAASQRGNCDRKQVGAVIVMNRHVVCTGYAGALVGMPNCIEVGHDMVNGHCVRTVHAEMNALCQAAAEGIAIRGGHVYSTTETCWPCFRALVAAGIERFVFLDAYTKHVAAGTSDHADHRTRIQETIQYLATQGRTITMKCLYPTPQKVAV
jgi:dCMP deaminase